jgi:predicted heme/steroid binding protein
MEENYLTTQQLAYFNGEYGARAYIAFEGVIYDVTESSFWQFGRHQGNHQAGMDLTDELNDAPHGEEIIKKFPIVGYLLEDD